ncbi:MULTISPECIES: hypothetical protein [unclassified Wolbachia]|uniref:hypothetical protein n=1 Tax=unclassified Wolbachia TaxID=2640676 RepID=UPI002226BA8A|nr:hypothetical protein [Wolbachia endosymbiont (group B) of Euphydryas aurinia]
MLGNLQRGIVAKNSGRWGDNIFKAPEQKLNDQSTQYGKTLVHRNESNLNDLDPDNEVQYTLADCYKICDERHPKDNWWDNSLRKTCKAFCPYTNETCLSKCRAPYHFDKKCYNECKAQGFDAPKHPSQESTPIDVSAILQDIGDNFHVLADSVSVL